MPGVLPEVEGYLLHPALLDACLQVFAAIFCGGGELTIKGGVYLPIALESLRFAGSSSTQVRAHARLKSGADTSHDTLNAAFLVADVAGRYVPPLPALLTI